MQTRWLCWLHRRRPLGHVDASTVPVDSCLQAPVTGPPKTHVFSFSPPICQLLSSPFVTTRTLSFPPPWAVQWFKLACGPRQCLLHNGAVGGMRERTVGCSKLLPLFDCFHSLHYSNFKQLLWFSKLCDSLYVSIWQRQEGSVWSWG